MKLKGNKCVKKKKGSAKILAKENLATASAQLQRHKCNPNMVKRLKNEMK